MANRKLLIFRASSRLAYVFLATVLIACVSPVSWTYNIPTHRFINEHLNDYFEHLKNLKLGDFSLTEYLEKDLGVEHEIAVGTKRLHCHPSVACDSESTIGGLLGQGGEDEDYPPGTIIPYRRSRNHFHNPVAPTIGEAFYSDFGSVLPTPDGFCQHPDSSALWLENQSRPSAYPPNLWNDCNPGDDSSWASTRNKFYLALTRFSSSEREGHLAEVFLGLGHLTHLVEDASVPFSLTQHFSLG